MRACDESARRGLLSRASHLHYGINETRDPLTSNSLPWEIDRFRFAGTAVPGTTPGVLTVTGTHEERRAYPLAQSVSDYSR